MQVVSPESQVRSAMPMRTAVCEDGAEIWASSRGAGSSTFQLVVLGASESCRAAASFFATYFSLSPTNFPSFQRLIGEAGARDVLGGREGTGNFSTVSPARAFRGDGSGRLDGRAKSAGRCNASAPAL